MHSAAERLEFMPPAEPAAVPSFGLAILAHVLLLVALAWGINWQKQSDAVAVEAELWSALPQEAAPPPPPPVVTAPAVVTAPPVRQVAPPEPPAPKPPDINIEREKKLKEAQLKREQDEADRRKLQATKAAEQKAEQARKEREEQQAKAAKDARDKARQQAEAQRLENLRRENLTRMLASAGGTGSPTSAGTARQSSGPSADYAGRIRARVKPNIVFMDDVSGNPTAEVEVRLAPDGTIVGKRLVKPSGVASWDDAVMRALDRTAVLPRDTDGRVPSSMVMAFRPKD